jgi:phosphoglucomutase
LYKETLISITKKGMNGAQEIAAMMQKFRDNPPATIDGVAVAQLLDYELQTGKNLMDKTSWKIDLPKSNVLQFLLADGSKISARPSGTEPKIKFYFSVNTALHNAEDFDLQDRLLEEKIARIEKDLEL